MSEDNPLVDATKIEQGGSRSNAEIHDRTGLVLAIIAFGISILALGATVPNYFQSHDMRSELLQEIQRSESRMIEDNRNKNTAFTLLDAHYRELKAKVEAQDEHHERR